MPKLYYKPDNEDKSVEINTHKDESVLEGLLRCGHDIPNGCRAGICQSCIMVCDSDSIPSQAQAGLTEAQKKLGQFLSCRCIPEATMHIRHAQHSLEKMPAQVLEKTMLSNSIVRLRVEKVFDYKPGQFCTIWKNKQTARSYSIASLPQNENFLEFHIKKIPDGSFSNWAYHELKQGDQLAVQGPLGQCFYTKSDNEQALFLAGIGTGLAPLYGIVRDALQQGHSGKINLVLGAKQSENYYLVDPLLELEQHFPQLHVHFITQKITSDNNKGHIIEGDIYQETRKLVPEFKGSRVFLCGAESFVKKMKKQCFLAGASMTDISADAFLAFGR